MSIELSLEQMEEHLEWTELEETTDALAEAICQVSGKEYPTAKSRQERWQDIARKIIKNLADKEIILIAVGERKSDYHIGLYVDDVIDRDKPILEQQLADGESDCPICEGTDVERLERIKEMLT